MRSFEIMFSDSNSLLRSREDSSAPERRVAPAAVAPAGERRRARGKAIDLFVDGANVTSRIGERHALPVMSELGRAICALAQVARGKRIVRFFEDGSEFCVERFGADALVSLYRVTGEPNVMLFERKLPFAEIFDAVRDASLELRGENPDLEQLALELESVQLLTAEVTIEAPARVTVEAEHDAPVAFYTEFSLRRQDFAETSDSESADAHALLFRGRLRLDVRGRSLDMGECFPFFVAEKLIQLSGEAVQAWERGLQKHVRVDCGNLALGVRTTTEGKCALVLGSAGPGLAHYTFPGLAIADLCDAMLDFGRALVRGVVRQSRSQARNLRVVTFRRQLREATELLRAATQSDTRINESPESYRAYARAAQGTRLDAASTGFRHGKLRYRERFRALVPGLDLRATFVCGPQLVLGAEHETFCLDRKSGEVQWRMRAPKASTVITPQGLVRISSDGQVALHRLEDGSIAFRSWLSPRVGGPVSGAVINSAGLPKMLVVTEGDRHFVGLDLVTGEARWRASWGHGGTLRMRRFGKLLYLASGDSALSAVDVATGESVWKLRDRLRFRAAPVVEAELAYALAGGSASSAQLYGICPFSGELRFVRPVGVGAVNLDPTPLRAGHAVVLVHRTAGAAQLSAFHCKTGEPLWSFIAKDVSAQAAWVAVDDRLIGHCPSGALVGLDAATGARVYSHAFGRVAEEDRPRRLEPVLRSGALFIPHSDVPIVRPADGELLGRVGLQDTIADLLRVDEECNVYLGEESGHFVAVGAVPATLLVDTRARLAMPRDVGNDA